VFYNYICNGAGGSSSPKTLPRKMKIGKKTVKFWSKAGWGSPVSVDSRGKRLESDKRMKSEKYRKRYTREFKEEAVRLLLTTDQY
jgi:hypothetical protein